MRERFLFFSSSIIIIIVNNQNLTNNNIIVDDDVDEFADVFQVKVKQINKYFYFF